MMHQELWDAARCGGCIWNEVIQRGAMFISRKSDIPTLLFCFLQNSPHFGTREFSIIEVTVFTKDRNSISDFVGDPAQVAPNTAVAKIELTKASGANVLNLDLHFAQRTAIMKFRDVTS